MERNRDWMDQAERDLRHAENDLERGSYDWACFSSQQAAERAIKAVLQKMGADIPMPIPRVPRRRYTEREARRSTGYAERIIKSCADLLPQI